MEYLFVYGTLLSYFQHPLNQKLQKEGSCVGKGFIFGKLYDSGEYPVAIPDSESIILGEVYKIPEILFFDLDDYEDYNLMVSEHSLFKRKKTKIYLINEKISHHREDLIKNKENLTKLFGWVYWYNQTIESFLRIIEGDYIKYKISNNSFISKNRLS